MTADSGSWWQMMSFRSYTGEKGAREEWLKHYSWDDTIKTSACEGTDSSSRL